MLFIINKTVSSIEQKLKAFSKLLGIMDELREKCPWDKKQTYQSLRHLTIEETYELGDAILDNNEEEIKKELGDLLLHIIFYAKIGSENKSFDITDVCNTIVAKLIYRHPHIFPPKGGKIVKITSEKEVKQNWEKLKLKEGTGKKSILEGVPKSLPALVKASRIQEKVAAVGFEWQNTKQFYKKIEEELQEFKTEISKNNQEKSEEEFGDLLFALINLARFKNINVENALEKTNKKFINRFQYLENEINSSKLDISDLPLEKLMTYWKTAKGVFK
ncbi:MAG: nucleoside triphosphate pyrophosphohydrolase [Flavobacteriaceae bacterium]|nr:nucleoside triphosphate pyrophosphohydrolase [Flavobacteriaceae bacterium]